jgi:hypothetical protein
MNEENGLMDVVKRYWGALPNDRRIKEHLERQRDLDILVVVRLDTGEIVPVGESE